MNAIDALNLARENRLSGSALHVLIVILQNASIRPTQIAQHTGMSCASVSGITDTLCERGWTERIASRQDRRCLYVVPTEKAYETFAAALE